MFLATNIFVAECWASDGRVPVAQLTKKQIFGDAAVVHTDDMAQPSQRPPFLNKELAQQLGSGKCVNIFDVVLPGDA